MKSKLIQAYKEERIEIFNKKFGVIFDGEDNLKSLAVENIIDSSPTAFQCADTYSTFLAGAGFEIDLSNVNLSEDEFEKYNPNNLLFDVCDVLGYQQGVYVLVGYNANYEKDSFKIIPYTLCKVGKKDTNDFSGKILVSKKGWGKSLKKEEIDIFDVYNPRSEVIQAQVEACEGWENYKGQIHFFKLSKKTTYPKSLIERAYLFADVENQIGLYYNGTVKRGFENTTMIRHRKFPNRQDQEAFEENIKKLSGLENASSKLVVEDDWDDEREKSGNFKFDTIVNDVKAEKYAHFENSSSNFIRKAFKNIPPSIIDMVSGKLGHTSADDLKMAQSIYNSIISKDQEKVETFFSELFRNYKDAINPTGSWTIKQYALLDDGTVDYAEAVPATPAPSLNSINGIILIQKSIKEEITSYEAGIKMIELLFGYSNEQAKEILKLK